MTVDNNAPSNPEEDESRASAGDDEETKARKRKERLEQNRISARESRKRKKSMIEELQRTVITLSRENKELNERNDSLRRQLMEIGAKYPNIVPLQAIVGQGAAAATGLPTADASGGVPPHAALAAAAAAGGGLAGFNPLGWMQAGAGAAVGQGEGVMDSANV